ncbi:MAG: hypothetical protein HGA55_07835 [Methanoregulaceae archaeon]|nr:hypothetical protein [Methanoregulaceae archaeon]
MTKTVCSDCGKECKVPFTPTQGRPVSCRDTGNPAPNFFSSPGLLPKIFFCDQAQCSM